MKVAYLIVAHDQPEHLAKLIKSLDCDWAWFFIHIDLKSEINMFRHLVPDSENIVFLDEVSRRAINWGGFSIVEAVLLLLSKVYGSTVNFDRFCLLSGSDFPVKPLDRIQAEFESNVEYMRVDQMLTPGFSATHTRFISHHYFTDSESEQDRELSGKIGREIYSNIPLYHGSAWWSLTRECMDYIVDFLDENPDYVEYHRTTFCPDEIFFHSIVKNSPFSIGLVHDFENISDFTEFSLLNKHGCHYIDWNTKNTRLPKTLNLGDLYFILKSEMLFARKFDVEKSSSLLSAIECLIENRGAQKQNRSKTIIVFQTHILTKDIISEFYRIKAAADQQTIVKLFYDNSSSDFDSSSFHSEDDYFLFDVNTIYDYFKIEFDGGLLYGNANLPLLYFSLLYPDYQYYWCVEYDVRFTGDWASLIKSFMSSEADLLGTTLYSYNYCTDWSYWNSIKPPAGEIDPEKLIRGFFPVVRYSKKACQLLIDAYLEGWRGHFEVLVPTVLSLRGCSIEDIGGDCEFTPPERRNLFYSNSPKNEALAPGTFRFQPVHSLPLPLPDMLYHPIKPASFFR